jgi:hypothetical protein
LRALLDALLLRNQTLQLNTRLFGWLGLGIILTGLGKIGHIFFGVMSHGYNQEGIRKSKLQGDLEKYFIGTVSSPKYKERLDGCSGAIFQEFMEKGLGFSRKKIGERLPLILI